MRPQWMYIIYFRHPDGQVMRYVTNDYDLYRQELARLEEVGREVVRTCRFRL